MGFRARLCFRDLVGVLGLLVMFCSGALKPDPRRSILVAAQREVAVVSQPGSVCNSSNALARSSPKRTPYKS